MRLWLFVHPQELETLDDKSIDDVASLLKDNEEAVKSFAARIVGTLAYERSAQYRPKKCPLECKPIVTSPLLSVIVASPSAAGDMLEALEKIRGKSDANDISTASIARMTRNGQMKRSREKIAKRTPANLGTTAAEAADQKQRQSS
jgi:hypothetical protein